MRPFASLRRRADFSRMRARGRRIAAPDVVIFRSAAAPSDQLSLVGIAVSKAVGNAVKRNAVRRRVLAILDAELAQRVPVRLLVVARPSAKIASYDALRLQIGRALAS